MISQSQILNTKDMEEKNCMIIFQFCLGFHFLKRSQIVQKAKVREIFINVDS